MNGDDGVASSTQPFFAEHCFECHGGDAPEAGLNLQSLSTDLADAEVRRRWVDLYDRVDRHEMPPATARQPDSSNRAEFLEWLRDALTSADRAGREVVLRRLNRTEYEYTVRDLFGIYVDVQSLLPDDATPQGFDTTGSELSLSAEHMLSYLEAADLVLDQVFGPPHAPQRVDMTVNIKDMSSHGTADKILSDGVLLFSGAKELPLYGISVAGPHEYRLTIQAKAVQSDHPVVMQVSGGVTGRIPGHTAGFFEVPPGEVTTIELTDRAVESSDTYSFGLVGGFPWWAVNADEYKGEGLFLGNVRIQGPIAEWPPISRAKLLGDVDPATARENELRVILTRILPGAYRRTITDADLEPLLVLSQQALAEGASFESALRRGLKGMLCSPAFLFLDETPVASGVDNVSPKIDDFALASRLSYLLWSSAPDETLLEVAARSELCRPDMLRAQVDRMLTDEKSQRFVHRFTGQWLKLDDIDFTVPDENLYPEYNQLLRQSMLDETHAFFREILDHDLSVQTFIDSDFVMINEPLADFYGIDGVNGLGIRRVELPSESLRGGVLTQASVLKVSADGTRTSPVLRGAWILKNLFGMPSPPPPPTVVAVEPDIRGATTIREQLAKHRDHDSCDRCHRTIDPPGFALESFDVIGAQRDWYRTRGAGGHLQVPRHPQAPNHFVQYRRGPDVDSSGTTSDGQSFRDIREFKQLLLKDDTTMIRSLTRQLLTYGLGRHLSFSDRPDVERLVEQARSEQFGLRSLLSAIVTSDMFLAP